MEHYHDFEAVIHDQRDKELSTEEIVNTIQQLPNEHLVDYMEFLEQKFPVRRPKEVGEMFLRKLGSKNPQFLEKWSGELDSVSLEKLERLVLARADNLVDVYFHITMPTDILNEFVLLKAKRIDEKFQGKYHNALALLELGVEMNSIENVEELFDAFLRMEKAYYEENHPNVDINTFYKLVIPMLKRYSIKKGPSEFYELRGKVINELRNHGVNPGHLSIEILERRGKHRRKPPTSELYEGVEYHT